jgi:hypothetical protein
MGIIVWQEGCGVLWFIGIECFLSQDTPSSSSSSGIGVSGVFDSQLHWGKKKSQSMLYRH